MLKVDIFALLTRVTCLRYTNTERLNRRCQDLDPAHFNGAYLVEFYSTW